MVRGLTLGGFTGLLGLTRRALLRSASTTALLAASAALAQAQAQAPAPTSSGARAETAAQAPDGKSVFDGQCAACHANPTDKQIPNPEQLAAYAPDAIVASLTEGFMKIQGQRLTPEERRAVAEYLTGRAVAQAPAEFTEGLCGRAPPLPTLRPGQLWNGWGPDVTNTRFQKDTGGLNAADVPNLELKWAFGIPGATQSRAQPAVVGGRVFMGSPSGAIYALDAETGCTYWTFKARAGVRTAISVGPVEVNGRMSYAIYFADAEARAYAVDAASGALLWSRKVDEHPAARATGAPVLYAGRLYVPVSGVSEETAASMPDYECCTFRGSLSALDASTGEVVWKTYTVDEPKPRGKSTSGKQLWGPAGVPIWSTPTVDAKRGLLYAATGNAYADPPPKTSDAVIAFSIETGAIEWVNQLAPGDVWILGCDPQSRGGNPSAAENPNCPDDVGPDFDFSASPALVTAPDGRDLLVVTQKSGLGYALDPEQRGKTVWQYRWGKGAPIGGVWGVATDGERVYFGVADQMTAAPGGLHAVDLVSGKRIWYQPPQPLLCKAGPGCSAAQSAAVTAIPGVVFSGSADGGMRAYDAATGKIVWTYDTNRSFDTVNGVEARGASMDGPGPVVAGGMLYVTAGNGGFVGRPGNVLLAFAPRR
ncbi:MAG TPA: PQQ-binding-like beta-propeller repeat protein [Gammaproteobacteria bacterium]|nr:PQQ-binding-like beta-propeller repeat protein [Gammaproteobacteria bacterium]